MKKKMKSSTGRMQLLKLKWSDQLLNHSIGFAGTTETLGQRLFMRFKKHHFVTQLSKDTCLQRVKTTDWFYFGLPSTNSQNSCFYFSRYGSIKICPNANLQDELGTFLLASENKRAVVLHHTVDDTYLMSDEIV